MSKKTDYVNAQFDNAEIKIQELFDEISKEATGAEISSNYYAETGYVEIVLVYKKGDTVYLAAACLLNTGYGLSHTRTVEVANEWGTPPEHYYVEERQYVGDKSYYKSFELYPRPDGNIEISLYNSGSYLDRYVGPAGPMVIQASWKA